MPQKSDKLATIYLLHCFVPKSRITWPFAIASINVIFNEKDATKMKNSRGMHRLNLRNTHQWLTRWAKLRGFMHKLNRVMHLDKSSPLFKKVILLSSHKCSKANAFFYPFLEDGSATFPRRGVPIPSSNTANASSCHGLPWNWHPNLIHSNAEINYCLFCFLEHEYLMPN